MDKISMISGEWLYFTARLAVVCVGIGIAGCQFGEQAHIQRGNQHSYHYIHVFGSYFPVPAHYGLVGWDKKQAEVVLQYNILPNVISRSDIQNSSDNVPKFGIIKVGKLSSFSYKKIDENPRFKRSATESVCDLKVHKYNVNPLNESHRNLSFTVISDEANYISILESDKYLWRRLLDIYCEKSIR